MLTPATTFGSSLPSIGNHSVVGHDPDEEVGREERSEEHHLGDDEKQHPEELGLDARGLVGRRRPVVLVSWAAWPAATDADSIRPLLLARPTCSTGLPVEACDAPDQVAAQPARAGLGEGRDHDVVGRVELERVLDRRVRVGVHDLADRVEPGVLERLERVREPLRRVAVAAAVAVRAAAGRSR